MHDRAVDARLELRIERERLGEATVLGGHDPSARVEGDEVVLHRLAVVLASERRGCLSGARQADDQQRLIAARGRDNLASGMQREPTLVVGELVPHAQPALLGLAEVVAVEDASDPGVEVDRDHTIVRIPGRVKVGRVDHRQHGREIRSRLLGFKVQPVLHAGDVGIGRFDVQPRRDAVLGIVADVPVDDEHVLVVDVGILARGNLGAVGPAHRLVGVLLGPVGDHVGAGLASRDNLGLNVVVVELRVPCVGHPRRQLAQLRGGGVPADGAGSREGARIGVDDGGHDSSNIPGHDPPLDLDRRFQEGFPDLASIAKAPSRRAEVTASAAYGCRLSADDSDSSQANCRGNVASREVLGVLQR